MTVQHKANLGESKMRRQFFSEANSARKRKRNQSMRQTFGGGVGRVNSGKSSLSNILQTRDFQFFVITKNPGNENAASAPGRSFGWKLVERINHRTDAASNF